MYRFAIFALVAVAFLLLPAAPAAAKTCACSDVCCPGPHNPDLTCETACCTVDSWTTCGNYGMPGCSVEVSAEPGLESLLSPALSVVAPEPAFELPELDDAAPSAP